LKECGNSLDRPLKNHSKYMQNTVQTKNSLNMRYADRFAVMTPVSNMHQKKDFLKKGSSLFLPQADGVGEG
jgi:hypothetical protein